MLDSCAIIGAGPAGVRVAEALRDNGFSGRLSLIGAERHPPYYRPALSKEVLLDESCPQPAQLHDAAFYTDREIDLLLGVAATHLDPHEQAVRLASGSRVCADAVVLATGASARPLDIPGGHLSGVLTLRTADDAAEARQRLDRAHRVVIIGGGFIGTEVAAAAVAHGHPTTVVEAADLPMSAALGPEVAERLVAAHQRRGVVVRTNTSVLRFEGDNAVTGVMLGDGELLPTDLVIIGVGAYPNTTLGLDAGLEASNGIHTDNAGRTSHPAIFAAGDIAATPNRAGVRQRCEHWQHARDAGDTVARAILGRCPREAPVPWFWSDQFDLNIQLAGSPAAGDARAWRGDPNTESFSVAYHRDGTPTGITAVNRGQDVRPAIEMMKRGMRADPERLADTSTPLRKLLKVTTSTTPR